MGLQSDVWGETDLVRYRKVRHDTRSGGECKEACRLCETRRSFLPVAVKTSASPGCITSQVPRESNEEVPDIATLPCPFRASDTRCRRLPHELAPRRSGHLGSSW